MLADMIDTRRLVLPSMRPSPIVLYPQRSRNDNQPLCQITITSLTTIDDSRFGALYLDVTSTQYSYLKEYIKYFYVSLLL